MSNSGIRVNPLGHQPSRSARHGLQIVRIKTGRETIPPVSAAIGEARLIITRKPFTWKEVYDGLELIANSPVSGEKVKRLTVNIRLATGHGIMGYKDKELTEPIDSVTVVNEIMRRVSIILKNDQAFSPENYFLVRQLINSLHVISEVDTIVEIRELAAYLDERMPTEDPEEDNAACPAMKHMRNEIHSRLNPQENIIVIQNLIEEIEPGLEEYKRSGQVRGFGPRIQSTLSDNPPYGKRLDEALEKLKKLKSLLEGLDLHGTQPGDIEKRIKEIRGFQRFLKTESAVEVNKRIEEFFSIIKEKDFWKACVQLGELRNRLNKLMVESSGSKKLSSDLIDLDTQRLSSVLIDLSLEKIGYILYGQIIHGQLSRIERGDMPGALKILKSLMLSVRAKGQGDEKLGSLANKIDAVSGDLGLFFLIDRIDRQCVKISNNMSDEYKKIAKEACKERGIVGKNAADIFVTQMIRGTTLQHLSDLISKIHAGLLRTIKEDRGQAFADNLTNISGQLFSFSNGDTEGGLKQASLLGNKGAYLCEMAKWGIPVPPGFVISTMVGREYLKTKALSAELKEGVKYKLNELEELTGMRFGDPEAPLVVSVRSGAKTSMPGMMDTILNVGLNDQTVKGLAKKGGELFALDSYRRFIELYSHQILGMDKSILDSIFTARFAETAKKRPLTPEEMRELIEKYKAKVMEVKGRPFPQDVFEQLFNAIEAVFMSWNSERAVSFRNHCKISDDLGTAATIQSMAFGNIDEISGTGKLCTRNRCTGERMLHGEFQYRAQGDDVMSGSVTPYTVGRLERQHPEIYKKLEDVCRIIEKNARGIMEIEFTIEGGKIYILQARKGELVSPEIETKAMAEMKAEGIDVDHSGQNTNGQKLTILDPNAKQEILTRGFRGSAGAATGFAVLDSETAIKWAAEGKNVILLRPDTSPSDYPGIEVSKGVLTSIGGTTSHAAECARGMNIPCVTGCESLKIDMETRTFRLNGFSFKEGDELSIDGWSGKVLRPIPVVDLI